jgi:hypothetical protein
MDFKRGQQRVKIKKQDIPLEIRQQTTGEEYVRPEDEDDAEIVNEIDSDTVNVMWRGKSFPIRKDTLKLAVSKYALKMSPAILRQIDLWFKDNPEENKAVVKVSKDRTVITRKQLEEYKRQLKEEMDKQYPPYADMDIATLINEIDKLETLKQMVGLTPEQQLTLTDMLAEVKKRRGGEMKKTVISGFEKDYKSMTDDELMDEHRRLLETTTSGDSEAVDELVKVETEIDRRAEKDSNNIRLSSWAVRLGYIRKNKGKWTVYSESGKPMGTYDTREKAVKRLRQIEYFKHKKGQKDNLDEIRKDILYNINSIEEQLGRIERGVDATGDVQYYLDRIKELFERKEEIEEAEEEEENNL